jgi:hypothetical protein
MFSIATILAFTLLLGANAQSGPECIPQTSDLGGEACLSSSLPAAQAAIALFDPGCTYPVTGQNETESFAVVDGVQAGAGYGCIGRVQAPLLTGQQIQNLSDISFSQRKALSD